MSRFDDPSKGAVVLVMQRLHVDDLAGVGISRAIHYPRWYEGLQDHHRSARSPTTASSVTFSLFCRNCKRRFFQCEQRAVVLHSEKYRQVSSKLPI
jgi:hypothetical protein